MLNGFGWPHILIIAVLLVLLFGAKRLPDAARGLGRSMRILKAETQGLREEGGQPQQQQQASGDFPHTANTVAPQPQQIAPAQQPASSVEQPQVNREQQL